MKALILLGFAAVALHAQNFLSPAPPVAPVLNSKVSIAQVPETAHEIRMRHLWVASVLAMTAGTTADAVSSWNKRESNSLLASSNGTFGAKGVAIKAGIGGAVLVPQIIFRKHKDWHAAFAASNFVEAGVFGGAAIHNVMIK